MKRLIAVLIVLMGSVAAFAQGDVKPYRPGPVPPDGALRYCIQYGNVDAELLGFLQRSRVNFLHWHGPFSGYNGLEPRSELARLTKSARQTIDAAHAAGMACILYIGPCFSYGDKDKRTLLFEFYDKRWAQYEDYFGKKPGDLLEMAQCNVEGKPRPYVYERQEGYHLCVNSPGVRQMTKGLIRMIVEAGGDGSFYDGPYVTEGRCYCKWCKAKFREWLKETYTAEELRTRLGVTDLTSVEPPKSAKEKLWVPFRRFNAWSLLDFMRDTKAYGRSLNPNYIMTSNYCMWMGEPFSPIRGTAEDAEVESQVVDVLFDEARYGAGPRWESGRISNSTDYRHLLAAAQGVPVALLKTAPEGTNPEAGGNLTRLAMAEGAANGGTWQLHRLKPAAAQGAEEYGQFLAARQEALTRCRPWATVAIWTSATQAYYDLPTYPTAVSRYLADNHVPHKLVIDAEVEKGKLGAYEVLIVPEVAVISGKQLAALQAFAKQPGKHVILIGPCGRLDEWGEKREEIKIAGAGVLPSMALPQSPNEGLNAADKERLKGLLPLMQELTGQWLPAWVGAPEGQVEVTTGYDGRGKLLVHVVNYGVEMTGRMRTLKDVLVRVRLPEGVTAKLRPDERPTGARLYTAEQPEGRPQAFEIVRPGPEEYAEFRLAELGIYAQVEFELLPVKRSVADRTRLVTKVEGEAAPGATVVIEAKLEPAKKGQWWISPGGAWQIEQADIPGGKRYTLKLGETIGDGYTGPEVSVRLPSGRQLTQMVWMPVQAPFEMGMRTPAFADMLTGRTRLAVTVRSRLPVAAEGALTVTPPEGWTVEGLPATVSLKPQASEQVVGWLRAPQGVKPGAYEVAATLAVGQRRAEATATLSVADNMKALQCRKTAAAPVLDGNLEEECWKQATAVTDFQRTDGKGNAKQQTVARVCYDERRLYIAFECLESEPETIINLVEQDGGEVWRDDSVEVFMDPGLTRRGVLHWTCNTAGKKSPAKGWEAAAKRTERGWNVEMALPIGDLKPQVGEMWGINLCRTRPSRPQNEPEYSAWSFTPGAFAKPERFGVLVFGE
ncbi:MAG: sugar-binding protein [Armatimonadia bacterium]